MRIRTNATEEQMHAAAKAAGVSFARFTVHGARTHAHGYDVVLRGTSNRRANGGYGHTIDDGNAATWDEWGVFLANVFSADPTTDTGYYQGRGDFHEQTGGRYTPTGINGSECRNHKWVWARYGGSAHCAKGCGAVRVMTRVG